MRQNINSKTTKQQLHIQHFRDLTEILNPEHVRNTKHATTHYQQTENTKQTQIQNVLKPTEAQSHGSTNNIMQQRMNNQTKTQQKHKPNTSNSQPKPQARKQKQNHATTPEQQNNNANNAQIKN